MTRVILLLLGILAVFTVCDGYKILVIFPMPAKSHKNLGDGVVRHLLDAGHEVTLMTAFPENSTNPKLQIIDVSEGTRSMREMMNGFMNLKTVLDGKSSYAWMKNFAAITGNMLSTSIIEQKNFQELLADTTQQFDAVIAEWFFNDLMSAMGGVYNVPFIWVSTIEPHWMILQLIDEVLNPAYHALDVTEKPPFTFGQRVQELWFTIKHIFLKETFARFMDWRSYNRIIAPHIEARGRTPPSFRELQYNSSLVIGNSHVSMGEAVRLPQNYISVGGYHIQEKAQPLSEDLKKIIENAKHGVIYFSMGSNLKSRELPEELKKDILEVFGSLKQTVLWKFEEKIADLPNNVHILEWAPQQSILAHPNVLLFITHGGLLSTTETIYAGKPIIGIPVFTDQFVNVARAVSRGFALKVDLSYSMAPKLKEAIHEILSNPKYTEQAKYLSFIHHDRPVKPGKEMVHWIEHVIKTKGAPHLRSAALQVPWYQKLYLDLIFYIFQFIMISRRIYGFVKRRLAKRKEDGEKKTN